MQEKGKITWEIRGLFFPFDPLALGLCHPIVAKLIKSDGGVRAVTEAVVKAGLDLVRLAVDFNIIVSWVCQKENTNK